MHINTQKINKILIIRLILTMKLIIENPMFLKKNDIDNLCGPKFGKKTKKQKKPM